MTYIQLKPISQQVVAVVGASSGIGRATALMFAEQGAKLVVSARSEPGLTSLIEEIQQMKGAATAPDSPPAVVAQPADVADFEQVKAIADKAIAQYGRLDTWVHAAATAVIAPFEQVTPEEFQRVIQVNLMGQVYGAMAALPHLRQAGRGAMIHVTSVEAHRSLPLQSSYSASKHGVEGFLDALRVELQHDGVPISVTNVMPATINTPFYNNARTKLGVQPMGIPPYYQPELVAKSILYAAENPVRDLIVGDAGRILDFMQKLSPGLLDRLLSWVAVPGQHTSRPKAVTEANNLFRPVDFAYNQVRGDYDDKTFPSFLEWFDWHPGAKWGALAGLAAVVALTLVNRSDG